jgi:hypothetical protein
MKDMFRVHGVWSRWLVSIRISTRRGYYKLGLFLVVSKDP